MKIRIFFIIAIMAFAITGAAIFVNASDEHGENCELSNEATHATANNVGVK